MKKILKVIAIAAGVELVGISYLKGKLDEEKGKNKLLEEKNKELIKENNKAFYQLGKKSV